MIQIKVTCKSFCYLDSVITDRDITLNRLNASYADGAMLQAVYTCPHCKRISTKNLSVAEFDTLVSMGLDYVDYDISLDRAPLNTAFTFEEMDTMIDFLYVASDEEIMAAMIGGF